MVVFENSYGQVTSKTQLDRFVIAVSSQDTLKDVKYAYFWHMVKTSIYQDKIPVYRQALFSNDGIFLDDDSLRVNELGIKNGDVLLSARIKTPKGINGYPAYSASQVGIDDQELEYRQKLIDTYLQQRADPQQLQQLFPN